MIQLKDLDTGLTEVLNSELGSIVGGDSISEGTLGAFSYKNSSESNSGTAEIPVGSTGFGIVLPTSGSVSPTNILQVPQINYNTPGLSIGGSGDGTFGFTANQGSIKTTFGGNPSTGSLGIKVGTSFRF
jgi:hypothetical protein